MPKGSPDKHRRRDEALKRVPFRPNRAQPARQKHWSLPDEHDPSLEDTAVHENVRAKGELSRKRSVAGPAAEESAGAALMPGTVVAVRGQYVEVDDGRGIRLCTVRRVLRTRLIRERGPVVVGDQVLLTPFASAGESQTGVIESVQPRRTVLARSDGRRTHTIAANVEQALIITSIQEPRLKPHLIDRFLVAAHAGGLSAVICVNKVDLDNGGDVPKVLQRYTRLGYPALATSALSGEGLEELRALLAGKATILAGQSGVGKSSLLNALQPGLNLPIAQVSPATDKGRHTTTTAVWYQLAFGAAVVDTPGIRALDVAMVPLHELEMHFIEFVDLLAHCKFPDCVHIHETPCAIKAAVEAGQIDPVRYDSYVEIFMELSETRARTPDREPH